MREVKTNYLTARAAAGWVESARRVVSRILFNLTSDPESTVHRAPPPPLPPNAGSPGRFLFWPLSIRSSPRTPLLSHSPYLVCPVSHRPFSTPKFRTMLVALQPTALTRSGNGRCFQSERGMCTCLSLHPSVRFRPFASPFLVLYFYPLVGSRTCERFVAAGRPRASGQTRAVHFGSSDAFNEQTGLIVTCH